MTKPYELLIFDWDGTLMDSAAKIVACLRTAVAEAGLEPRSDARLRHIIGLGIHEAVDFLYPHGIDPHAKRTLIDVYRHRFLYADNTPSALFEGVAGMLATLESQGYWLAVVTGKSRRGLNQVLAEQGLQHRFHSSRCADETASKPDPLMLREILAELDVKSSRALMIGDTQFDIEMAHRMGVDAVAVAQGAHGKDQLLEKQPLAILARITNLISWLSTRVKQAV